MEKGYRVSSVKIQQPAQFAQTAFGYFAEFFFFVYLTGGGSLMVKGLDKFFREEPLSSFAVDVVCQPSPDIEKIQEISDRLYANLIDNNTNSRKVAETLGSLDVMFKIDKNKAVRLLAMTVIRWYNTATNLYMNARYGLGLKQPDRAMLGEQFRADVDELILDTFTTLQKKKSPQNTEISEIIRADCRDISELVADYSHSISRS